MPRTSLDICGDGRTNVNLYIPRPLGSGPKNIRIFLYVCYFFGTTAVYICFPCFPVYRAPCCGAYGRKTRRGGYLIASLPLWSMATNERPVTGRGWYDRMDAKTSAAQRS
ncbi:hypothetical protein BS17DRAFT_421141 [Gyrodon lividus]|nr:hypothetical protein BS17DRAFT_421141 [Gyrodon lividus]